ncbi:hypothetical protein R9C00_15625 [Flammeovirgaceae bacterium SG7u.111]|nr:hypothetical protein [Flammeovirgaceae bacterium SG7u.132]WPO33132.1 hypothetical protein R9C00_15625 [Flammeovirgaceae bacterium SG7u.111]
MLKKHLLFFVAIPLLLWQCAEKKDDTISKGELALLSSLEELAGWDWNLTPEIDPDSLVEVASEQLTKVLATKVYDENDSIENLKITISPDGLVRVFTFSYYSGGTRGEINNSVIQFQLSKGKYLVAPSGIEASFHQIHKLPSANKTLYLLIGEETGESRLLIGVAKTIEITPDNIHLEYPGFAGKYPTLMYFDYLNPEADCFACIDYNPDSHQLELGVMDENDHLRGWVGRKLIEEDKIAFSHLVFKDDQFITEKKK